MINLRGGRVDKAKAGGSPDTRSIEGLMGTLHAPGVDYRWLADLKKTGKPFDIIRNSGFVPNFGVRDWLAEKVEGDSLIGKALPYWLNLSITDVKKNVAGFASAALAGVGSTSGISAKVADKVAKLGEWLGKTDSELDEAGFGWGGVLGTCLGYLGMGATGGGI